MKRSIARKWAKSLESGEIKQVRGTLRKGDAMCCLGVLCNLHAQEHPEYAAQQPNKKNYGGSSQYPPQLVTDWAGLSKTNPYVKEKRLSLASMNDSMKMSFPEIAKIIRKHWREL